MACFITWRTYGTWLPGDARTSFDHGRAGEAADRLQPDPVREDHAKGVMNRPPRTLANAERRLVDAAIRATCAHRGWTVHALNVRTNHVHVVVEGPENPKAAMNTLKAWATRQLREGGLAGTEDRIWVRGGSARYLNDVSALEMGCDYVRNRQ